MAGAAEMALTSPDSPGRLREKVTSKGGTTAEALKTFDALGFESMVHQAMQAAYRGPASWLSWTNSGQATHNRP